jgi:hypothetical protein
MKLAATVRSPVLRVGALRPTQGRLSTPAAALPLQPTGGRSSSAFLPARRSASSSRSARAVRATAAVHASTDLPVPMPEAQPVPVVPSKHTWVKQVDPMFLRR